MIQPLQQDDAFLADVEQAAETRPDHLHIWWLGQSGFLVQWQGRHLLFDPYLSDSLTRKYADTDKPHERMTARVIAPERLGFIDVVTSSHNHTDHLDGETLQALFGANPGLRLVLPAVNQDFAEQRLGGHREAMVGLVEGESREAGPFVFTGMPAAHEDYRPEFLGFHAVVGPWALYHSGDTLRFPELDAALGALAVDVAFLPINGRKPERRVAGNLDGAEAAELAQAAGMGLVVPCHYEMFSFNTASPERFERRCRELDQPFRTLRAGERLSLEPS